MPELKGGKAQKKAKQKKKNPVFAKISVKPNHIKKDGKKQTLKVLKPAARVKTQLLIDRIRLAGGLPKTLPIGGRDFAVGPVSPVLVKSLREEFNRQNITILEVAPGHDARHELISHMIGAYALKFMERQARFYYIDYLEQRVRALRRYFIRDIGLTFGEIVDKLIANGVKVFLHGGIVRDLFTNTRSTDIDIVFDTDVAKVKDICERENWPCAEVMIREQYINFGQDKGISLEGSNLKASFIVPIHFHEATVNDMSFDMTNQILIDYSGMGIVDVLARRLRITPAPKYWQRWAEDDFKKPMRFFKLIQKGYTPATPETLAFVVNYIRDNFDIVYEKQFSPRYPVSRIKHFLIKNITMGDIDAETGVYTFGANEDKLIPFLQTIKRYVGRDIFIRMLAHFTPDDLTRFKTAKVITTLSQLLSSQEVIDAHAEISAAGGFY
jgi:hypothetical protein